MNSDSWPVSVVLAARYVFGVGPLSEWVGQLVVPWGRLEYVPLPCCAEFYGRSLTEVVDTQEASENPKHSTHRCNCIRTVRVLSANVRRGVVCELSLLGQVWEAGDDAASPDYSSFHGQNGGTAYSCLLYAWSRPFGPYEQNWEAPKKPNILQWWWKATGIRALTKTHVKPKIALISTNVRRGILALWAGIKFIASPLQPVMTTLRLPKAVSLLKYIYTYLIPGGNYNLIVNGRLLPIQPNLYSALVHLGAGNDTAIQRIWIDAICIDQSHEEGRTEKASQVHAMHQIYANAKSTSLWLGAESPTSPIAPNAGDDGFMHLVQKAALTLKSLAAGDPEFWDNMWKSEETSDNNLLPLEQWRAIKRFLQRPYWQRMWVLQEIISASTIEVSCGMAKLTWDDVCSVSQAFTWYGMGVLTNHTQIEEVLMSGLGTPHRIEMRRSQYSEDIVLGLRSRFASMILDLSRTDFECEDGRDMLYAHLGVCRYERLPVTYEKPVTQVYTEFWAEVLLRGPTTLNFLACVEDRTQGEHRNVVENWKRPDDADQRKLVDWGEATLPSWVPDFHVPLEPRSLTWIHDAASFTPAGPFQFDPTLSKLDIKLLDNTLALRGWRLDIIDDVSESGDELHEIRKIPMLLNVLYKALMMKETPYGGGLAAKVDAFLHSFAVTYNKDCQDENWPLQDMDAVARLCHDWFLDILAESINLNPRLYLKFCWPELIKFMNHHSLDDPRHEELVFSPLRRIHDNTIGLWYDKGILAKIIPTEVDVIAYAPSLRKFLNTRTVALQRGDTETAENLLLTKKPRPAGDFVGMQAKIFGDHTLTKKRLFLTSKGYLGKSGQSIQPGDQVWIFTGSPVPLILRPVTKTNVASDCGVFELVGHSYVHGVMNGEAMKSWDGKNPEEIVIV
jgi:hypothetical protein